MRVKKAEYVKDYKIKMLFSNGVAKVIDFKPFLHSTYALTRKVPKKVKQ